MSDDSTAIDLTPPHNPKRLALAQFVLAMVHLLEMWGIDSEDVTALGVNFDGYSKRLDVARLDGSGHLERILLSLAADPTNPDTFATPIGMPAQPGGQTH